MKLKGQKNQCQGCKQYFNSNVAFEKHRFGKHGHGRRCLTPDEMVARGMALKSNGFWVASQMSEEAKAAKRGDVNHETESD